jgi:hypothetical protein
VDILVPELERKNNNEKPKHMISNFGLKGEKKLLRQQQLSSE